MSRLFAALLVLVLIGGYSLGNTKELWAKELAAFGISGQTKTWNYQKDRLNISKSSEALVFLPDHARSDDITVVFWFHGCGGYSDRTFDVRLAKQLDRLKRQNHSYALVVPELLWSKNTSTKCGRQSRSFRKSGSLISFVEDSISKINSILKSSGREIMKNPRMVFLGHSAGGSVFKAAAISGDLCKINPGTVVWSDSTYGNWFNVAWERCLHRGKSKTIVLVRKWTKTWKRFRRFFKKIKDRDSIEVKYYGGKIYHKTIGDNAIEFSEIFPDGC